MSSGVCIVNARFCGAGGSLGGTCWGLGTKAAIQQLIRQYFADHDYAKWEPVDARFFVTATSGLAWGPYTLREQRRVGPRRVLHGRYTFTCTRQADEWVLLALDFSPLS